MNEQSNALRLADKLDQGYLAHTTVLYPAADELRRLHEINSELCRKANTLTILSARDADKITALEAINQELLSALKECIHFVEYDPKNVIGKQAKAAIAKAERTTP